MAKEIHVDELTKNIREMCIETNLVLTQDMREALESAKTREQSQRGMQILDQL